MGQKLQDTTLNALTDAHVGRRLESRRMELRLTREALAEKAGVATRLIADIEGGNVRPSARLILAFATALGITPSWFFGMPITMPECQAAVPTSGSLERLRGTLDRW